MMNSMMRWSKYDFIQKLIIQQKANTISLNSQFSTTSDISRFDKLNDIEDGIKKYIMNIRNILELIKKFIRLKKI